MRNRPAAALLWRGAGYAFRRRLSAGGGPAGARQPRASGRGGAAPPAGANGRVSRSGAGAGTTQAGRRHGSSPWSPGAPAVARWPSGQERHRPSEPTSRRVMRHDGTWPGAHGSAARSVRPAHLRAAARRRHCAARCLRRPAALLPERQLPRMRRPSRPVGCQNSRPGPFCLRGHRLTLRCGRLRSGAPRAALTATLMEPVDALPGRPSRPDVLPRPHPGPHPQQTGPGPRGPAAPAPVADRPAPGTVRAAPLALGEGHAGGARRPVPRPRQCPGAREARDGAPLASRDRAAEVDVWQHRRNAAARPRRPPPST